ncbi:hypothetical protein D3C76_649550 [compost metagenome]
MRRWISGVIAMAIFFVAKANFQAVFMAIGTQQAHLDPGLFDQCVERHSRPVDAQIAVGNDLGWCTAEGIGDLRQTVAYGQGAVMWGGRRLEQLHVALMVGEDEISEGAAGIDAQAILLFAHFRILCIAQRGCAQCAARCAWVAASSSWPLPSITTPYSRRAPSIETKPLRTSARTVASGRRSGSP